MQWNVIHTGTAMPAASSGTMQTGPLVQCGHSAVRYSAVHFGKAAGQSAASTDSLDK